MSWRAASPCTFPGCPHPAFRHSRCASHKQRPSPSLTERTWADRQRRAAAVRDWIIRNGYLCPGFGRPAHSATDLTADHVTAIATGGDPEGELTVLCRACNTARGDRPYPGG